MLRYSVRAPRALPSSAAVRHVSTPSVPPQLKGAADKASALVKTASESATSLLGAYREPIVGNALVAKELVKQVYVAEKLSPPSLAQVQQTYTSFFHSAKDFGFWRTLLESGEWKKWGIYAVEAYGIFKIGEMIGRRHIVGYKLKEPTHEVLHT